MPLHDALFCETNPGPVKYAASRLGLCAAEARLPLCRSSDASERRSTRSARWPLQASAAE